MSQHVTISPSEAADRLAIRELVDAYAYCADRRDAEGQMSLFTADTHFVVYMDATSPKPSQELHSRAALAPVFADLNKYAATMHFNGQSTVLTLSEAQGSGTTYCMAHHLTIEGQRRRLMIAALRYLDRFVKVDGAWLFSERLLYVDWARSVNSPDSERPVGLRLAVSVWRSSLPGVFLMPPVASARAMSKRGDRCAMEGLDERRLHRR